LSLQQSQSGGRDFVMQNIVDAGTQRRTSTAEDPADSRFVQKPDYGRVPTYLHDRKMELAAGYAKQQVCSSRTCISQLFQMSRDVLLPMP
jgi:hypothetical protein